MKRKNQFYLLLALLLLAVFGRTLFYPLLWWDDRQHICMNPALQMPGWQSFWQIWSEPYWGLYAPLTYSAWAFLSSLAQGLWGSGNSCFEMGPLFHGFSLLLHFANAVLVYQLLNRVLDTEAKSAAWFGALIFALHPLQVESVAWVSSQRDLLSVFFGLLGLVSALRFSWGWAVICFFLSCLAKATGVVFLALAILWIFTRQKQERFRASWFLAPAILAAGGLSVLAKSLQADHLLKFELSLWERPLVFLQALGFSIGKVIWPVGFTPDYGRSIANLKAHPWLYASALWVLPVIFLVWKKKEFRAPLIVVLVSFLPYSGLMSFGFQEISTVADRFFYASFLGIAWIGALGLQNLPGVQRKGIAVGLLATLAALSFYQSGFWENDRVLFSQNLLLRPQSSLSLGNLGNDHYHQGQYAEAESFYQKALELNSQDSANWLGYARTLEKSGKREKAEEVYQQALQKKLDSAEIYNNLGSLLYLNRRDPLAENYWKKAAALNAKYFEPRYNLGVWYIQNQRWSEAKSVFQEALQISPENPLILNQLKLIPGM